MSSVTCTTLLNIRAALPYSLMLTVEADKIIHGMCGDSLSWNVFFFSKRIARRRRFIQAECASDADLPLAALLTTPAPRAPPAPPTLPRCRGAARRSEQTDDGVAATARASLDLESQIPSRARGRAAALYSIFPAPHAGSHRACPPGSSHPSTRHARAVRRASLRC